MHSVTILQPSERAVKDHLEEVQMHSDVQYAIIDGLAK